MALGLVHYEVGEGEALKKSPGVPDQTSAIKDAALRDFTGYSLTRAAHAVQAVGTSGKNRALGIFACHYFDRQKGRGHDAALQMRDQRLNRLLRRQTHILVQDDIHLPL